MMMKITISKEKKDQYFASLSGDLSVHAVGSTPDLALEYLIDVYHETTALRKEIISKKIKFLNLKKSPLLALGFKSLQVSI